MKTALVIATALLLLTFAAPTASAGPQCPAVQPWWGICNAVVGAPDRVRDAAQDLQDEVPPVP